MNLTLLKNLAAAGESETVEFKKSTADLSGACESLCGMLNAGFKGQVFIGISGGKLIGQEVSDRTQQEIAQHIKDFTPDPQVQLSIISIKNKRNIIVLEAQSASNKIPYFFRGKAYLRIGTTTSLLSRDRLQAMFEQYFPKFDEREAKKFTLKDIDPEWVMRAVELGIVANRLSPSARGPVEDTLTKFELIDGRRLTNAAVILFGKSTSRLPLQCNMMVARFKGVEKGEFLDHKLIIGNAFHILDEGMMFLSRHLPLRGRFEKKNIHRIDEPLIPTEALREALVNAICHRDYENSGSSIHLAIYDDRVEIMSSGGLMPGIRISDLKKPHKSILRNPLIARAFYYVGYVEQWGQGTLKITKLCKDFGLPEPEFIEHPLWFGISFRISAGTVKSLENILNAKQEKILELLRVHKKLTIKELHNKLPAVPRRTLQWELQLLKDKKLVDISGKGRLILWTIFK